MDPACLRWVESGHLRIYVTLVQLQGPFGSRAQNSAPLLRGMLLAQQTHSHKCRQSTPFNPMKTKAKIALVNYRGANAPPFPALACECEQHKEEQDLEKCMNPR